jgi:hypothetical protein
VIESQRKVVQPKFAFMFVLEHMHVHPLARS